ncbi:Ni/Fe hydrogenase subunit alpha [Patescibacteria group bacterium]|nr:Ni/Fe hydrogenase subunit alpha [Patescibacteria group bacterium]
MKALEQQHISKIEGHGHLKADFKNNRVQLIIDEGERYFEKLVIGRRFQDAHYITSRICGVCPVAHQLAAIKAVEDAFRIEANETIKYFRRILLAAQIIQSHTLHLYFLALPDYLGLDSTISLADKDPKKLRAALDLKHFADETVETIGGKAVHPTTPTVGGFLKLPKKKDLVMLINKAEKQMANAKMTIELFARFKYPELMHKIEFLTLDNYDFYEGDVISNVDTSFKPKQYKKRIREKIKSPSSAKYSLHYAKNIDHLPSPRPFMTGALARINNNASKLKPKAKLEKSTCLKTPNFNPYYNNLAQAIELVHALEIIIEISQDLINKKWQPRMVDFKPRRGSGVGAVEAPRGVLYHYIKTNKDGDIVGYDIIPPTAQNLSNLEQDAKELIKNTKTLSSLKRRKLLEMLVRAYDPCITCSVH